MKAIQLAALLLIVCISCASALKCNHCISSRGERCMNTVKECDVFDDVCVSVIMGPPINSYFRRCSRRTDAQIMQANKYLTVTICETDLCN